MYRDCLVFWFHYLLHVGDNHSGEDAIEGVSGTIETAPNGGDEAKETITGLLWGIYLL